MTILTFCFIKGWERADSEQIEPLTGSVEAINTFLLAIHRSLNGPIPFYPFFSGLSWLELN